MARDPLERYLKKRFCRGRGTLARAVDYVSLRLILFAAAYLLFRTKNFSGGQALLLSGIALAAAAVLLRLVRLYRFGAFVAAETARAQKTLFFSRLCQLPESDVRRLAGSLNPHEKLAVLRRAEAADADAVLAARNISGCTTLLCTAGYTPSARTFTEGLDKPIRLIETKTLFQNAASLGLLPSEEDARKELSRLAEREQQAGKRRVAMALSGAFPEKYFLSAALLTALSFFTRYALHYRLLAALCICAAAVGKAFSVKQSGTIDNSFE